MADYELEYERDEESIRKEDNLSIGKERVGLKGTKMPGHFSLDLSSVTRRVLEETTSPFIND